MGEFEITDPAAYEIYRAKIPNIISTHGGRILVRGGIRNRSMALCRNASSLSSRFDSLEAAKAFYAADAYQAVLPFRLNTSTSNRFTCLLTGAR